jgi:hypothetical protein
MLPLVDVVGMSNDPAPASVSTSDVRVEKEFEADEFPVSAIAFEIESLAEEPVQVRIIDRIPDSFPMEGIGFHPDYESDNWTAYRDNRVEYARAISPDETVVTVYGIRIDDPSEADQFLDEPTVETTPVDEGPVTDDGDEADVLGRETTQVVRDALSGEAAGSEASEPGLGDGSLLADAPEPRDLAADATVVLSAGSDLDRLTAGGADEAETEDDTAGTRGTNTTDRSEDGDGAGSAGAVPGSVAAALAAELRAGDVDEADLDVLSDHLDVGVPTSVDARIERLQSRVEDVLAYRDALGAFLDEEGTGEAVLAEVRDDLAEVREQIASMDERLADADANSAALEERLVEIRETVEETDEAVEDLTRRLDEDVEASLADLEARIDDLETDIEERLADAESDVAGIHAELEELREFRDRLSSAFGPGEE